MSAQSIARRAAKYLAGLVLTIALTVGVASPASAATFSTFGQCPDANGVHSFSVLVSDYTPGVLLTMHVQYGDATLLRTDGTVGSDGTVLLTITSTGTPTGSWNVADGVLGAVIGTGYFSLPCGDSVSTKPGKRNGTATSPPYGRANGHNKK